jgi:hypothetical protein
MQFHNTSPSAQITTRKAQITRLKDEIKFLHKKKDKLNLGIHHFHLQAAKEWDRLWDFILPSINNDLNLIMESKYKHLNQKIKKLTKSQTDKPRTNSRFYPRVVNKTNISFTNEEMALLNKGLKYSLHHKGKHWLSNLALEAEAALNPLPPSEQEHVRHQVAHKLYKHHNNILSSKIPRNEMKIVNQIKKKLSNAKAIITEADKGNSMIIMYESDYTKNVQDFISNNNFELVPRDVTKKLQRDIKTTIKDCEVIFPNQDKWKHTAPNPTTPTLKGLIKVHKAESPIRPVVNWTNAPTYKSAKLLVKYYKHTLPYHTRSTSPTPPTSSITSPTSLMIIT